MLSTQIALSTRDGDVDGALSFMRTVMAATDSLDRVNRRGATALHLAILVGNVDAATTLLDAGAYPASADADGNTPLHLACLGRLGYVMPRVAWRDESEWMPFDPTQSAQLVERLLRECDGKAVIHGKFNDARRGLDAGGKLHAQLE
jgi:hypothetical protein